MFYLFNKKKKDGGFPSFNYGIKGYWEFMRGYMVNNQDNITTNKTNCQHDFSEKYEKNLINRQNSITFIKLNIN